MTPTLTFWLIAAALLLVAMLFVFLPLWRGRGVDNSVLRDAANLEILRDQSAEMRTDLQNGLLTSAAYEQGVQELKARLLEEVKSTQAVVNAPGQGARKLALALVVILPLVGAGLYQKLGNHAGLDPKATEVAANDGSGLLQSDAALKQLETKLKGMNDPDKLLEGWLQLARSYAELKRYPDAERAYEEVVKLAPKESQAWTEYADAYAMNHGQSLKGKPTQLLEQALKLEPDNKTALALSGSAAMERGDYEAAIIHWQKLISLLPPDYPDVQMVKDGVKSAREFLAQQPGGKEKLAKLPALPDNEARVVANPELAVSGKVSLSAAARAKVSPEDTVFILARAAEGPKMPLAVLRKQVKDLPLEFSLDDSMAMQPQLKLSGFQQVVVVARISKAGQPIAQPGDWEGSTATIKPGSKGLNIVIEHEVK